MLNKLLISLLISSTLAQALNGACPANVTLLQEGEKASCKGFLFSPETAERATKADMQYKLLLEEHELILRQLDLYRQINKDYTDILLKEKNKTDIWQGKAEDYAKKYSDIQDNRQTKDWLFFGLGVLVTIGAGYAVGAAGGK